MQSLQSSDVVVGSLLEVFEDKYYPNPNPHHRIAAAEHGQHLAHGGQSTYLAVSIYQVGSLCYDSTEVIVYLSGLRSKSRVIL